jgi:capsular polysaccharide export protein
MKIICIGYYDDFARFFLALKKELHKNEETEIIFNYLSIYLSGYLYFLLRLQNVSFFSMRVWLHKIRNTKKYTLIAKQEKKHKGVCLETVIKYHMIVDPSSEFQLKVYAIAYIEIISKYLTKQMPDTLILSGDTRMCTEIFDFFAKKLQIKTFYFEQGPFGTTIFDTKGVNGNASIRDIRLEDLKLEDDILSHQKVTSFLNRKKQKKHRRNPIYRAADYGFDFVFNKLKLSPLDTKIIKQPKNDSKGYEGLKVNNLKPNTFLLVLQVPQDANMTHHSPFFENHFSIVKDVFNALPPSFELVVREHPLYKNRYEKALYIFIKNKSISLDNGSLDNSIENARVVVVNNSTVGIEAIAKYKPVVVLGNSYYDNDFICLKLKEKENLKILLQMSLGFQVDKLIVQLFLNYFFYEFLIPGHYRDRFLQTRRIVNKLRI